MSVTLQQSLPVPLPEQTHKHGHHHSSKNHSNKRKAQRVQRACSNCRKRKQGCEEERPCKRCVEKGIDCVEVEAKRKRGRAKGQTPHSQRSRSDSRSGDEMVDYDQEEEEENMEDLCDSDEEELLSDEDSNNSHTAAKPSPIIDNFSSNTGRSTPTFRLGDASSVGNHSTGSMKVDSSTPLSSSHSTTSFAPISRSSSRSHTAEIRHRSSSVSSDITGAPESPEIDRHDSNIKEDPTEVVMEEADSVSATPFPNRGMNLALLLPFIGNLCSKPAEQQEPMMLDEDYSIFNNQQLLESSTNDSASTYHPFEAMPADSLTTDLWHSDLPFYTTVSKSGTSPLISTEEGDSRALTYLKECWEEFLFRCGKVPDIEIQCIKESWKETIRCVRNLDWQKLQSSLQEMENLPLSYRFGQQVEPAMLFWTSGGRIHHVNDSFCKLVGYSEEELRLEVSLDISPMVYYHGHRMRAHSIFHPDEAIKILKKQLEAVQSTDKSCYQMNTRLISKSRREIPVSCCILNLRDNFGLPLLTVAVFL